MARILLVEDVDVVRMVLRRMLVKGGHEVVEASGVEQAMNSFEQTSCEIVVTDVWMPGQDGVSLIDQIRKVKPDLPIIAISGGAPRAPMEFSLDVAARAGANRVILKPVAKEELLESVAALLAEPSR